MKKMILAAAALAIAGQAHAGLGSRDSKPRAEQERKIHETARQAGHSASPISREAAETGAKVKSAFNGLLNADMLIELQSKMSTDTNLRADVEDALSQAKSNPKIAGLRIKSALLRTRINKSSADPLVKSFLSLSSGATKKAVAGNWPKETKEVMEGLLENAVSRLEKIDGEIKDSDVADAMKAAKKDVETIVNNGKSDAEKVDIKLEDIERYCG